MIQKMSMSLIVLLLTGCLAIAQDIPQSQVPSIIVNKFQQDYPKAHDIDWEMDGENYEVEFELGLLQKDHEILYSPSGEILRHKQEITKSDLPEKVKNVLKNDYSGYRIKDVDKIEMDGKVIYKLEAKSLKDEWDLTLDEEGNILSNKLD